MQFLSLAGLLKFYSGGLKSVKKVLMVWQVPNLVLFQQAQLQTPGLCPSFVLFISCLCQFPPFLRSYAGRLLVSVIFQALPLPILWRPSAKPIVFLKEGH